MTSERKIEILTKSINALEAENKFLKKKISTMQNVYEKNNSEINNLISELKIGKQEYQRFRKEIEDLLKQIQGGVCINDCH